MKIPLARLEAIALLAKLNRDILDAKTEKPGNTSYVNPNDIMSYVVKTQELANKVEAIIKADETPAE